MKCPHCDAPEKVRVKYCTSCGHAYANEDLLELRQLEYLLDETADWDGVALNRKEYLERLEILKARILPAPVAEPEPEIELPAAPEPEPEPAPILEPAPIPEPAPVEPVKKTVPPKEKVPFDQWLLSERNIKIALYSGAILLVLAGIIFIGVNWTRFSGGLKFAITSLITGLTYFGGFLLFKRPALKLGGNALFGIAGGFFALNFGVLQIYVLGPMGLPDDVMWLITSPLCLILYMFTAHWTKSDLFTYFSIAALSSTIAAALVVASAPLLAFFLAFSVLATLFWGLAVWLKKSTIKEFTVTPLIWVSQIIMPVILGISIGNWAIETGCTDCFNGSPFLAIAAMGVGVLFYIFTDLTTDRKEPRWAISILFTVFLAFTMLELESSDTTMGIGFMLQALAYLWIGYWLDKKEGEAAQNAPFYLVSYVVASYITYSTFLSDDATSLIIVLFGDVLLLGCTSFIKQDHRWLFGAVWLTMLPVYLLADLLIHEIYFQGLVMFGLGVLNLGVGYTIGRENLKWSGPFLTATAFLSVITVGMTLGNLLIASIILLAWTILYPLAAVWLKWTWLIVPGLVAANFAIATLNIEYVSTSSRWEMLTISYTGLGILCWLAGRWVSRIKERDWSWGLYILGAIDIAGAYLVSLWIGEWLAIGVSFALSAQFFVFASLQVSKLLEKLIFPFLPYLGVGILFISHFYLLTELHLEDIWPAVTAGVCTLFAAIAWLLKDRKPKTVYGLPFRLGGLGLMAIPLVGSLIPFLNIDDWVTAIAFAVSGLVYLTDAGLRRLQLMAFPGMGGLFVAHLFLIKVANWTDYWTAITVGVCALFAAIAWLLRGKRLADVYELPFRLGGLALILIPLAGTLVDYKDWIAALVFAVCGVVYLIDAGLRRLQRIAFPGVAAVFITQFFILDAVWPDAWEFWAAITVGVCTLFAVIAWLLRGRKLAKVYELPFRLEGLGLMIVPLVGTGIFYEPWVAALVFAVCGVVYLVDAGLRRFQLIAFPGMVVIFVAQFFIMDAFWADAWEYWPAITVGVCALFAAIAWLLREHKLAKVYELPFRLGGLGLMIIPLVGSVVFFETWVSAIVLSLCGLVYLVDAGLRRLQFMAFFGVSIIFIGHFFIRDALWPGGSEYWQIIAAGICTIFALVSWMLRNKNLEHVYGLPFRLGGLVLILVPLSGAVVDALFSGEFLLGGITFWIAGVIYLGDAIVRDVPVLGYLGVFNLVVGVWAALRHYEVTELQAYVLPFGLALLGIGWYERVRYKGRFYRLFTMVGCVIMLGTAFYQSLPQGAWEYALLTGIESIIAITWGIRTQSRGYVQVGGVALIANALIQFIPSFLEWSRWLQVGLTGSILLGLGLVALFKREKLLETRKKVTEEWRSWKP